LAGLKGRYVGMVLAPEFALFAEAVAGERHRRLRFLSAGALLLRRPTRRGNGTVNVLSSIFNTAPLIAMIGDRRTVQTKRRRDGHLGVVGRTRPSWLKTMCLRVPPCVNALTV